MLNIETFFNTSYGRNLAEELNIIAPSPYLVVTDENLLRLIENTLVNNQNHIYLTKSMDLDILTQDEKSLPDIECVIGVGGGVAHDIAKFFAWKRNLRLFQLPTSIATAAVFSHRVGVREKGLVKYIGWTVPEVIYVDYDLIRTAPVHINRAGIGDIFSMHDALYDWKYSALRETEKRWPWDEEIAFAAREKLLEVRNNTIEVNKVSDSGIRLVMETYRWECAVYHGNGWNCRFLEGADHFFYYALEYITGKKFIHGEPVCLGIILMSFLTDNDPEGILKDIKNVGVRIHPDNWGVSKENVIEAFLIASDHSKKLGYWSTILDEKKPSKSFVENVLKRI